MSDFDNILEQSENVQECMICYDALYQQNISVFVINRKENSNVRSCRHYFHEKCIKKYEKKCCPLCNKNNVKIVDIEHPNKKNIRKWFQLIDVDNSGSISPQELTEALCVFYPVDCDKVCEYLNEHSNLWKKWDSDASGEIEFEELVRENTGVLDYLIKHFPLIEQEKKETPDLSDLSKWFNYWDMDHSGDLELHELVRAVIKTLKCPDNPQRNIEVRNFLIETLFLFDPDKSGTIDYYEFIQENGLGECLRVSLNFNQ